MSNTSSSSYTRGSKDLDYDTLIPTVIIIPLDSSWQALRKASGDLIDFEAVMKKRWTFSFLRLLKNSFDFFKAKTVSNDFILLMEFKWEWSAFFVTSEHRDQVTQSWLGASDNSESNVNREIWSFTFILSMINPAMARPMSSSEGVMELPRSSKISTFFFSGFKVRMNISRCQVYAKNTKK